jgi:two-component system OmpR family sensor kinase
MRAPRLGIRTRLLIAVVGAVALAIAVAMTAFGILLAQRLSTSATSLARAQAEAELSALEIRDGVIAAPDVLAEGASPSLTWIFSGTTALEAPRAPQALQEAAASLASGPEQTIDAGGETRLYALPVVEDGVQYGTVVSAVSLDAYGETTRTAIVAGLLLAVILLAAVAALAWWILGRAFRPVSRMTEDAASWSEHDLERRFDLGDPYDEVTRLAATLDRLLERVAASLRHEQRFAAELSHELRTPLARIRGEAELALRRERAPDEYRAALVAMQNDADQMTRTVEALVSAARQDAGLTVRTSDVREAIEAATAATRARAPGVEVRVAVPSEPVYVAAELELLEAMLQPLLDNAARYGRSVVEVTAGRTESIVVVEITDDGPGVSAEESERIFEPGARGGAAGAGSTGAGLGLPLARRLAHSAGGEVSVEPGGAGGRFSLALPVAR